MNKHYTSLADFETWELDAYADGEAMPHVTAFFQQNPAAKTTLRQRRQQAAHLHQALYRFDCPPPEALRDFFWQALPAAEQHRLAGHVPQCPHCSGELADLQIFMQTDNLGTQTQPATLPAPTLFERIQALTEQMRLVVATLVTPSTPQLATMALRGSVASTLHGESQTSLLFAAEAVDISLLLQKEANGQLRLAGQMFATQPTAGVVSKLIPADPDALLVQTELDDTGNFVVSGIEPGYYQLVILLPEQPLVIPNLIFQ